MVTTSVIVLFGLGLVAAAILSIASVLLAVEEDPRVAAVSECLPGANCGGCGYAGCDAYAAAVVTDPAVPANGCVAGGADVAAAVGKLTGKAAGGGLPKVSFRRCSKAEGNVARKYDYQGVTSCAAAMLLDGGPDACKFSCVGFGDCVKACPFSAMYIGDDNMVHIIDEFCTSCGICTRTCPNGILEIIPREARVQVFCSSQDKGPQVKAVCEVGCISCQSCIKKCPANAVSMRDNRIYIDHEACMAYGPSCEEACSTKCPRDILRILTKATEAKEAA
ncbi:MAG: RnfABCDGE type electron transport complex subunit B [Desulfovibrionaceae bacterium]